MRFFTAFCNHWHCTCAMVLSLLCNHWQFLLRFSAMAKQNQNPKKQETQKNKKNKMTRPNSLRLLPLLGCAICFFCFFVSWFFSCSAMAKQNQNPKKQNTTKPKNKKNPKWQDPTLCQYSPLGVCNLVFFVFLFFFGFFVFCFCFFGFLFFWFLVFWFVVGFLKG